MLEGSYFKPNYHVPYVNVDEEWRRHIKVLLRLRYYWILVFGSQGIWGTIYFLWVHRYVGISAYGIVVASLLLIAFSAFLYRKAFLRNVLVGNQLHYIFHESRDTFQDILQTMASITLPNNSGEQEVQFPKECAEIDLMLRLAREEL